MICACGEPIVRKRVLLGYRVCLNCGDQIAKKRRFTVVPLNKSNYMLITDLNLLKQLNPKRT